MKKSILIVGIIIFLISGCSNSSENPLVNRENYLDEETKRVLCYEKERDNYTESVHYDSVLMSDTNYKSNQVVFEYKYSSGLYYSVSVYKIKNISTGTFSYTFSLMVKNNEPIYSYGYWDGYVFRVDDNKISPIIQATGKLLNENEEEQGDGFSIIGYINYDDITKMKESFSITVGLISQEYSERTIIYELPYEFIKALQDYM